MKDLVWSMSRLINSQPEGSFTTQTDRYARLNQAIKILAAKNPKLTDIKNIKTKHIDSLVNGWLSENLSTGTIKNRVADLRWLANKINKNNIVKRTNSEYGIKNRQYVKTHINKAKQLTATDLKTITDPYTQLSLRLQQAFGLRREESMKFRVEIADQENHIVLEPSWCKGGRTRNIPIITTEQRELLNEIKLFCHEKETPSLIPKGHSYYQQKNTYEYQTYRYGVTKNHGLRHAYAQNRYATLTGRLSPKQGGKRSHELSLLEKRIDYKARMKISEELGHGREEITAVYLGR